MDKRLEIYDVLIEIMLYFMLIIRHIRRAAPPPKHLSPDALLLYCFEEIRAFPVKIAPFSSS